MPETTTPPDIHITYTADQVAEIMARHAAREAGIGEQTWAASVTTAVDASGLTQMSVRITQRQHGASR